MVIKGISKDNFEEIVNEKIKKDGKDGNKDKNEDLEDDIPAAEYKKAEPLIPILGYDTVKMIFSKNWRNKEQAIIFLGEKYKSIPIQSCYLNMALIK